MCLSSSIWHSNIRFSTELSGVKRWAAPVLSLVMFFLSVWLTFSPSFPHFSSWGVSRFTEVLKACTKQALHLSVIACVVLYFFVLSWLLFDATLCLHPFACYARRQIASEFIPTHIKSESIVLTAMLFLGPRTPTPSTRQQIVARSEVKSVPFPHITFMHTSRIIAPMFIVCMSSYEVDMLGLWDVNGT